MDTGKAMDLLPDWPGYRSGGRRPEMEEIIYGQNIFRYQQKMAKFFSDHPVAGYTFMKGHMISYGKKAYTPD